MAFQMLLGPVPRGTEGVLKLHAKSIASHFYDDLHSITTAQSSAHDPTRLKTSSHIFPIVLAIQSLFGAQQQGWQRATAAARVFPQQRQQI